MLLAVAPAAAAQESTGACSAPELRGATCARFAVPLDHASAQDPDDPRSRALGISYVRFPATAARRGTVVVLAGGPGQAAVSSAADAVRGPLRALRRGYDLVFVDQRGTGESSPLRCADAPRGTFADDASATTIARCAAELGDARRFFSTHQTVLDLEDLRGELGVDRIIPLGVSYGAQVAGEYARRFPERTQALVLDSASPIEGLDVLGTLPSLALPRVLREICFPPGCEAVLGRPDRLLAAAVDRLDRAPLRGRYVTPGGRRRSASITLADLYALVQSSDTDPALRTALPSALDAAARGDAAPLLRLAAETEDAEPADLNEIRFLATACTEGRLPWDPTSDPATRPGLLTQALTAARERLAPFPPSIVAAGSTARLCAGWPPTERAPYPPSPQAGPDVPVLVLAGREDLRTPLEDQRRTAAQFSNATLVAVPNVGHSVLGNDVTRCATSALSAFLNRVRRTPCRSAPRPIPIAMPAFTSLARVPGTAGRAPARVERTLTAVDLTLRDVVRQVAALTAGTTAGSGDVEDRAIRIGGLRGGRLELRRGTLTLRAYEVVGGVRVTGRLDKDLAGALVVAGTGATGALRRAPSGTLRGRLGGTRITYRPNE